MSKHALLALVLCSACAGEIQNPGRDEPIVIDKGSLHAGQVAPPPAMPVDGDASAPGTAKIGPLEVTDIELPAGVAGVGESRTLSGRVAETAYALAVQLAGDATEAYGSGYWAVPIDGLDPQYPGERTWTCAVTIGHKAPVGMAHIRIAGVDKNGALGPSRDVNLCISPSYPDNLNACDPTLQPPALVVQLQWDRDVDLDLEVVRPDGSLLSNKGASAKNTKTLLPGTLDTDALAGCKSDPRRTENAFWTDKPAKGVYALRTRLFSTCGQTSVRFVARALLRQDGEKAGTWKQAEVARWTGTLLAAQADGGAGPSLLIGNLELP